MLKVFMRQGGEQDRKFLKPSLEVILHHKLLEGKKTSGKSWYVLPCPCDLPKVTSGRGEIRRVGLPGPVLTSCLSMMPWGCGADLRVLCKHSPVAGGAVVVKCNMSGNICIIFMSPTSFPLPIPASHSSEF